MAKRGESRKQRVVGREPAWLAGQHQVPCPFHLSTCCPPSCHLSTCPGSCHLRPCPCPCLPILVLIFVIFVCSLFLRYNFFKCSISPLFFGHDCDCPYLQYEIIIRLNDNGNYYVGLYPRIPGTYMTVSGIYARYV